MCRDRSSKIRCILSIWEGMYQLIRFANLLCSRLKSTFDLAQVLWWAFPSIRKLCWHLWTHQTTVRLSCLSIRENQPGSYSLSFQLRSHECWSRRSQLGTHLQFGPGRLNQYLFRVLLFHMQVQIPGGSS